MNGGVIEAFKLRKILSNSLSRNVKLLDCTFPSRKGLNTFKNMRIPNSLFFPLEKFSDHKSGLSLTFPNPSQILPVLNDYKINKESMIICYDQYGIYSSPRVWFILKAYNFQNVYILNGGLKKWLELNYQTEVYDKDEIEHEITETNEIRENELQLKTDCLMKYHDLIKLTNDCNDDTNIIDTRSNLMFKLEHIPKSKNIPFNYFTNSDSTFKSSDELKQVLLDHDIDLQEKTVFSCGVGLSACIGYAAVTEILKLPNVKLYDGSLEEYKSRL
jgi:thiosulfate/3-mercaptopyruvate sulfurtransferase